jgi:hypothetical protein
MNCFSVHPKWRAMSQIHDSSDNTTQNSQGLRNQEILAADLNHKSMRLDNAETFCATSTYLFMQYVMWRHLAGTTLSHVRS